MGDMQQKKLLMLGGSAQQIVAIKTAKRLGYYTVLCDYLPDNPGRGWADKFYLVSTIDRAAVLKVATNEKVDGVVAYASDPAAPTAAYVAEKLGLHGNPLISVETLCNKDMFRQFLLEHGFNVPKTKWFNSFEEVNLSDLEYPIIVKPADSSGSKGVTVLQDSNNLQGAVDFAFSYSRSHKIVVEEFIEKAHPYLIGGDIFVEDGRVILWGLLNCHRDNNVNPLVPVRKSHPLQLEPNDEQIVHTTLQKMISALGYKTGAMNVELIIDKNHECWLIDVGPRNGGNMIPDLLGMIYNVDVVEMTIKAAMGEKIKEEKYYATHNVHTNQEGVFEDIRFSADIEPYVIKKVIYKKPGDSVHYFNNAGDAIGIVFLKFDREEIMHSMLAEINNHIFLKIGRRQES